MLTFDPKTPNPGRRRGEGSGQSSSAVERTRRPASVTPLTPDFNGPGGGESRRRRGPTQKPLGVAAIGPLCSRQSGEAFQVFTRRSLLCPQVIEDMKGVLDEFAPPPPIPLNFCLQSDFAASKEEHELRHLHKSAGTPFGLQAGRHGNAPKAGSVSSPLSQSLRTVRYRGRRPRPPGNERFLHQ